MKQKLEKRERGRAQWFLFVFCHVSQERFLIMFMDEYLRTLTSLVHSSLPQKKTYNKLHLYSVFMTLNSLFFEQQRLWSEILRAAGEWPSACWAPFASRDNGQKSDNGHGSDNSHRSDNGQRSDNSHKPDKWPQIWQRLQIWQRPRIWQRLQIWQRPQILMRQLSKNSSAHKQFWLSSLSSAISNITSPKLAARKVKMNKQY